MLSLVDSAMENIPNKEQLKTFSGSFLLSNDLFHVALNFIAKAKNLDAVCLFLLSFCIIIFILRVTLSINN